MGCLTALPRLSGMPSHPCLQGFSWLVLLASAPSLWGHLVLQTLCFSPHLSGMSRPLSKPLWSSSPIVSSPHSSFFLALPALSVLHVSFTLPLLQPPLPLPPQPFSLLPLPLQPPLSSPFESGFPLGSARTPAVGWPFLTDIAALSCAIASLPQRRRHQRK